MVATHVLDERTAGGDLVTAQWLAGGRASALFATLAGVSIALMTGGRTPVRGRARGRRTASLAIRAVLVALVGLALGELDSGLAVILAYYGVLFLLALPFVGLGARALALLTVAWVVVAPVVSWAVQPELPARDFASPSLGDLADPGGLAAELLFTGYYPALPWLAYLLGGMALGRADLRNRRLLAALAAGGVAVAAAVTALSRRLTAGAEELLVGQPFEDVDSLLDEIATGMFGNVPVGGSWQWLLVVAPHSSTPFDLAQTLASAVAVIGVCCLLARLLPFPGRVFLAVLFGAGTMTLTLYSLHVVMRTPDVWPDEQPAAFLEHVVVLLGIGAVFAAAGLRGPLEWVVATASGYRYFMTTTPVPPTEPGTDPYPGGIPEPGPDIPDPFPDTPPVPTPQPGEDPMPPEPPD